MSHTASRDTIYLTTPHGHEVTAELDYDDLAVLHAKVINHYTGIMKQLDHDTADILSRALQAKRIYERALGEVRQVEKTLRGFGSLAAELGDDHPALAPYLEEATRHKNVARDMFMQARQFHESAMHAIDKIADA